MRVRVRARARARVTFWHSLFCLLFELRIRMFFLFELGIRCRRGAVLHDSDKLHCGFDRRVVSVALDSNFDIYIYIYIRYPLR